MLEQSGNDVDIRVLTSIGNCYRKLKSFQEGIHFFEAALEREGSNFYAFFGLGDCYRGLNQPKRSLEYWNRILEDDPRNKVILTRAGDAYRKLGDMEVAVDYYKRALNIEFDHCAILGLALAANAQGRYQEALESLKSLIQQEPKNHRLYMEAANTCVLKGDRKEAVGILEEFRRLGIRNTEINEHIEKLKGA
jgi:tetratricopeptide (TPR) repeat protein